jgi:hypothetical protein
MRDLIQAYADERAISYEQAREAMRQGMVKGYGEKEVSRVFPK